MQHTPASEFSIIITSHNQREFISDAVDSALAQQLAAKEVIVVDDGSSDASVETLERYADSIQLVRFPANRGAPAARNQGAARARGEYLVFLDGDDVLVPWTLHVYDRLIAERNPTVIIARRRWFEGALPVLTAEDVPRTIEFVEYEALMLKDRSYPLGSTLLVRRQSFMEVAGWSTGIFYLDFVDLVSKLGYSGGAILILSPFTVFYRQHAANSMRNVASFLEAATRLINRERAGQYPGGRKHWFERYAWLGGIVAVWTKKAVRAGLYEDAFRLLATGWPMVLAAISRRLGVIIRGRHRIESMTL